jgi:hypothetical protein
MIASNYQPIRKTFRVSEGGHPATRRNSKRHVNRSSRAAVRHALRDPRTW